MNKRLTLEEQEVHVWFGAAEPDVVHVEAGIPRYRRKIERCGHKPDTVDAFGVASFRLPIETFGGFRRGKRRSSPELKAKRAATLRRNALSRSRSSTADEESTTPRRSEGLSLTQPKATRRITTTIEGTDVASIPGSQAQGRALASDDHR